MRKDTYTCYTVSLNEDMYMYNCTCIKGMWWDVPTN